MLQKNLSTVQRPGIKRKREFELNFGALGDMENGENAAGAAVLVPAATRQKLRRSLLNCVIVFSIIWRNYDL